jgi:biopolymer transport protein ExbB
MLKAGGWVMVPLGICSVIVISLIIYCLTTLRNKLIYSIELKQHLDEYLENEDLAGLAAYLKGRHEAVALVLRQVLSFAYRRKDADADALEAVANSEGGRISSHLNQRVVYLLDVGALAPMLGLFGTVVGILRSFGSIAAEASPMRTMMLAGGVSQALASTACGLIVGITAMFFYSYFRGRVQFLISTFEIETTARVQEIVLLRKNLGRK